MASSSAIPPLPSFNETFGGQNGVFGYPTPPHQSPSYGGITCYPSATTIYPPTPYYPMAAPNSVSPAPSGSPLGSPCSDLDASFRSTDCSSNSKCSECVQSNVLLQADAAAVYLPSQQSQLQ